MVQWVLKSTSLCSYTKNITFATKVQDINIVQARDYAISYIDVDI